MASAAAVPENGASAAAAAAADAAAAVPVRGGGLEVRYENVVRAVTVQWQAMTVRAHARVSVSRACPAHQDRRSR